MSADHTTVKTYTVRLESGEQFACAETEKVLSAMERAGVMTIQVGCRGGGCGACRVKVISGEFEVLRMSIKHVCPEDAEQGYALACRIFPRSDLLIGIACELPAFCPTEEKNSKK